MRHEKTDEALRSRAMDFVLDTLGADDRAAYQAHLDEPCEACRAELQSVRQLLGDLEGPPIPVTPDPALKQRVLASIRADATDESIDSTQVWKNWGAAHASADRMLLRAGDGVWERTAAEGVFARRLFVDPERDLVTMMVMMRPGSRYPAHRHGGVEECYVLEGDLRHGEQIMHKGDFERLHGETDHGEQWTEEGCLLLIHSSLNDELLA